MDLSRRPAAITGPAEASPPAYGGTRPSPPGEKYNPERFSQRDGETSKLVIT